MSKLQKLQAWLKQYPHIPYVTPNSPDYSTLRAAYILDNPAVPLGIVRPQSAQDVSHLVSYAVSEQIDITVRSGGHDLYGRSFSQDALTIDMRDIAYVKLETPFSATIGGGILAGDLAAELSQYSLVTAYGSAPSVGYIGWSTHGGYGPFAANYGLGVDQILGAKVVNWEGRILQADETMLNVIRGGGGTLGVIVELTIKIYPLKQVLGGVIVYEPGEIISTIKTFTTGYQTLVQEGLPGALGIQQSIVNTSHGKALAIGFVWSSDDLDLGRDYLNKIVGFGKIITNTVAPMTITVWMDAIASFIPQTAYGATCSISLQELTEEVIMVIGEGIGYMPSDPETLCSLHQLRGPSTAVQDNSVFAARIPHFVFEFIATASCPGKAKIAWEWAMSFREALQKTDPKNILSTTYIALTPPKDANFPEIFGSHWEELVDVKKRYDPNNVFCHALPQFK